MNEMTMESNKTFFILKNGEVKTYCDTIVNDEFIPSLLVYDRKNPSGVVKLDITQVQKAYCINSLEFDSFYKSFVSYIVSNLANYCPNKEFPELGKLIYQLIVAHINEDEETVGELTEEYVSLEEAMGEYLHQVSELEGTVGDVAKIYHELLYNQRTLYKVYSKEWLLSGVRF